MEAHGVLGLIIGGNQSWESGNRLKDGDTAVSSLFASQEETTGQIESYIESHSGTSSRQRENT